MLFCIYYIVYVKHITFIACVFPGCAAPTHQDGVHVSREPDTDAHQGDPIRALQIQSGAVPVHGPGETQRSLLNWQLTLQWVNYVYIYVFCNSSVCSYIKYIKCVWSMSVYVQKSDCVRPKLAIYLFSNITSLCKCYLIMWLKLKDGFIVKHQSLVFVLFRSQLPPCYFLLTL